MKGIMGNEWGEPFNLRCGTLIGPDSPERITVYFNGTSVRVLCHHITLSVEEVGDVNNSTHPQVRWCGSSEMRTTVKPSGKSFPTSGQRNPTRTNEGQLGQVEIE